MDANEIKKSVKEHYAAVAISGRQGCCTTSDCCAPAETIQLIDDASIQTADLGLSCGFPTEHAGIQPGETVLDLGSGAGVDVFRAAKITGPEGRVIGVDMTEAMIARARENAIHGGYTNTEFRLGEIEALPVDDASVDLVLSNCVINLVPDKRRAFAEIYRVLRPGGRFSISDIVTYGLVPEAVRKDLELWAGCVAGALDQDEYLEIIRESGFEQVEIVKSVPYNQPGEDYGFASITVRGYKNT